MYAPPANAPSIAIGFNTPCHLFSFTIRPTMDFSDGYPPRAGHIVIKAVGTYTLGAETPRHKKRVAAPRSLQKSKGPVSNVAPVKKPVRGCHLISPPDRCAERFCAFSARSLRLCRHKAKRPTKPLQPTINTTQTSSVQPIAFPMDAM